MVDNCLTVDVEDYFMVTAFSDVIKFEDWNRLEPRIEYNINKILELFGQYNVKATYFVLGWVAEKYPRLIRSIHSQGHEIACHSYNHRLVDSLTPSEFKEDVRKAKNILENIIGTSVKGFRAPSWSIRERSIWALDILREEGFIYDSSVFPIYHDKYGFPGAERFPHTIELKTGKIIEIPPSTTRFLKMNVPISGGGYLRLLPFRFIYAALNRINKNEGKPFVLYIHPWEIDPNQPSLSGRVPSRLRHYINLRSTFSKLTTLVKEFSYDTILKLVEAL